MRGNFALNSFCRRVLGAVLLHLPRQRPDRDRQTAEMQRHIKRQPVQFRKGLRADADHFDVSGQP